MTGPKMSTFEFGLRVAQGFPGCSVRAKTGRVFSHAEIEVALAAIEATKSASLATEITPKFDAWADGMTLRGSIYNMLWLPSDETRRTAAGLALRVADRLIEGGYFPTKGVQ